MEEPSLPHFECEKLNFNCLGGECPNPCCGPLGGLSDNLGSLLGGLFDEIILSAKDANRIGKYIGPERFKSLVVQRGKAGEGEYAIRLKENMCCPFWKESGECEIDSVKPAGCRVFPLYIEESVGVCIVKTCPGVGQGWTGPEETQRMLDAASEAYTHIKKYLALRLQPWLTWKRRQGK